MVTIEKEQNVRKRFCVQYTSDVTIYTVASLEFILAYFSSYLWVTFPTKNLHPRQKTILKEYVFLLKINEI